MCIDRTKILNKICFIELVYERINKKLNNKYSKSEIEKIIFGIIQETKKTFFKKPGRIYMLRMLKRI
jgi:hypothetical protein